MYSTELVPPAGQGILVAPFFGREGEMPVQLMILIFRKNGQSMILTTKKSFLSDWAKINFKLLPLAGYLMETNCMI